MDKVWVLEIGNKISINSLLDLFGHERFSKIDAEKETISKLIEAANIISKSGHESKASYIHLTKEYIESEAQKRGISFNEMVDILKQELESY